MSRLSFFLLALLASGTLSYHDLNLKEHHDFCTSELVRRTQEDVYTNINMTANGFNDLLLPLYLNTYRIDKHPEGGTFQPQVELERQFYYSVASLTPCIRTICEIGFNSGSSALIWLLANPTANVVMFDLFTHTYSPAGESYLREIKHLNATSRLTIIKGSSLETVPAFAKNVSGTGFFCDLLSVDGSHRHEDAVQDIDNMMALANPQWNALVVDDTNCGKPYCVDSAIKEHLRRGNIHLVKGISLSGGTRGVSLLKYSHNHNKTAQIHV